jgi:3-dehydroquinate synthase
MQKVFFKKKISAKKNKHRLEKKFVQQKKSSLPRKEEKIPALHRPHKFDRMRAMKSTQNEFDLVFPRDSGFEKSSLIFYDDSADIFLHYDSAGGYPNRLFVTDENIARLDSLKNFTERFGFGAEKKIPFAAKNGGDVLCVLGAGEKFKTIESVLQIVKTALDFSFNRNCLFVAVGGGVICDMTGFASSIFKRGVDVEFVPTTLLADVDAAIGGKTGCDFSSYKNMIGAFYPAKKIHICGDFVSSLPQKEFVSGLGEVLKTAFLFSAELTEFLKSQKQSVLNREKESVKKMISLCAGAKSKIVSEDFREKGNRAFLNYGHTFGHALESVAGLGKVTHGEGVAWGISRAISFAQKKGLCEKNFAENCIHLLADYGYEISALHPSLREIENPQEKILSAMHKDKKNSGAKVKLILQKKEQDTIIFEADDEEILESL